MVEFIGYVLTYADQDVVGIVVVATRVQGVREQCNHDDDQPSERAVPQAEAQPKRHGAYSSRSTYPVPRSVWISRRSPLASIFWRSCLTYTSRMLAFPPKS